MKRPPVYMRQHHDFRKSDDVYWIKNPYPQDRTIRVKDSYGRVYRLNYAGIRREEP